jgi:hypothetical protein
MERCLREIAEIEAELMAGNPDVQGLCLALSDWSMELRLLQAEAKRAASDQASGPLKRDSLGLESIAAHSIVPLGGHDRQTHLLADRAGQEAAHGMRLPARDLDQFSERHAVLPAQEVQDDGRLALGFRARLLARCGCLLRRASFARGLLAFCADFLGCCFCDHDGFSFGGDCRHDIHRSGNAEKQRAELRQVSLGSLR